MSEDLSLIDKWPSVLTLGEAARYSGLHRDRITTAIRKLELAHCDFKGRRFVDPIDLVHWLRGQGVSLVEAA
jgi:hypothetical protein